MRDCCSCQGQGHGPDPGFRRHVSLKGWLERLKEYQRDLEQEVADVADLIRRLSGEAAGESPAT